MTREQLELLLAGSSKNPHGILGMHIIDNEAAIRVFNPNSKSIQVKDINNGIS